MADINIFELTYSKSDIDNKISYEADRLDASVALKANSSAISAPSGIAALDAEGKHKLEEIRFSTLDESGDTENVSTIINPKRMHYQIGLTTITKSEKGVPLGVVPLGSDGLINSVYLPATRNVQTFVVATVLEMYDIPLSTLVYEGDRCIVTSDTDVNNNGEWVASVDTPTQSDWTLLPNLSSVSSVNGQTGDVDISSISESQTNATNISSLTLRVDENEDNISANLTTALDAVSSVESLVAINIDDIANNTSAISTNSSSISGLTSRVSSLEEKAYCGYVCYPALYLTNTYQKAIPYTPTVTPLNISVDNGTFTALVGGVYRWSIERVYINEDANPNVPIDVSIDIRKNGVTLFTRSAIISSATAADEPATMSFTSPFIMDVETNDTFEFYFKATEGLNSPSSTMLSTVQLSANKIG